MNPLIRLENVTKVFGSGEARTVAVKEVTLEIGSGERVVLSGPSGSGKTTLLNLMSGLETPTKGRVFFEDQDLTRMDEDTLSELRLRRMGFVFQAFNLIPVLTAQENAELVLLMLGVDRAEREQRIRSYFEKLGIAGLEKRRPAEMSGGQQQRVAVVRALAHEPRVVFLDEPTANLDTDNARNLMDLLVRLNEEEGVTLIFSSHDPLVISYARRVIRLRDGRVLEDVLQETLSRPPKFPRP